MWQPNHLFKIPQEYTTMLEDIRTTVYTLIYEPRSPKWARQRQNLVLLFSVLPTIYYRDMLPEALIAGGGPHATVIRELHYQHVYPVLSMNEVRKHSATWVNLRHSSKGSPEDSFWPPSITFSTMADKLLPRLILLKLAWRTKFFYVCSEYLFLILCLIMCEEILLKRLWKPCNTEFSLKVYTLPSIKLKQEPQSNNTVIQ